MLHTMVCNIIAYNDIPWYIMQYHIINIILIKPFMTSSVGIKAEISNMYRNWADENMTQGKHMSYFVIVFTFNLEVW